jgi:hypothetical protein
MSSRFQRSILWALRAMTPLDPASGSLFARRKKPRLRRGFLCLAEREGLQRPSLGAALRARLASLGLVQICSCKFVEPSGRFAPAFCILIPFL